MTGEAPTDGLPEALAALVRASGLAVGAGEGEPATDPEHHFEVERSVTLIAEALARLHATPLPDHVGDDAGLPVLTPAALVDRVRADLAAGLLQAAALSDAYRHMTVDRLVEILAQRAPSTAESPLALTHGRPTLERARFVERTVRFVDWSRAALADPYRDVAVAARSVATGLGPMLVPVFVEAYLAARTGEPSAPTPADPVRLDWYALAGELSP